MQKCKENELVSRSVTSDSPGHVAHQTPLSMEEEEYFLQGVYISKQEYWSGLSFPSPEHLPDPRIKPGSPTLAGGSFLSYLGSPASDDSP